MLGLQLRVFTAFQTATCDNFFCVFYLSLRNSFILLVRSSLYKQDIVIHWLQVTQTGLAQADDKLAQADDKHKNINT